MPRKFWVAGLRKFSRPFQGLCSGPYLLHGCVATLLLWTSDHMLISFDVTVTLSRMRPFCVISFRNIKDINLIQLDNGTENLPSINCTSTPTTTTPSTISWTPWLIKKRGLLPSRTPHLYFRTPTAKSKSSPAGMTLEKKKTGFIIHKEIFKNHFLLYKDSYQLLQFSFINFKLWFLHHYESPPPPPTAI